MITYPVTPNRRVKSHSVAGPWNGQCGVLMSGPPPRFIGVENTSIRTWVCFDQPIQGRREWRMRLEHLNYIQESQDSKVIDEFNRHQHAMKFL